SGGFQNDVAAPGIQFKSTHHFIKEVSGNPLIRPAMFYNTKQQGEGLVDVTTHYIDLVQWMLSSERVIDIEQDIVLKDAQRWGTRLSKEEFTRSTGLDMYPSTLLDDVGGDESLTVFSNGKLDYVFKGVPVSIAVEWAVESLDGRGDQFYASFLTKAFKIEVKPDQSGKMAVFLTSNSADEGFGDKLKKALASFTDLPGLGFETQDGRYKILIPDTLYLSHEDHFAKVLQQFLTYRREGALPEWERSFILAKYYLTTKALAEAKMVAQEDI
ncbi:MAG TPA: putative oxidoreductase C-terminal domain-containing protein, partial [Sphingobacterium sp.]|nr:putative oxidoreductase C-terminal domain-containing protein [Sphingobacterium sp.]